MAVDLAARFRARNLEIVLRHQSKLFVNSAGSSDTPFRAGTGDELTLQLHEVLQSTVPFLSTAAEVLIATGRPERRSVRSICGPAFPGHLGELRIYASFDAGAEKGLLISEQQRARGAGLRYTPFSSESP